MPDYSHTPQGPVNKVKVKYSRLTTRQLLFLRQYFWVLGIIPFTLVIFHPMFVIPSIIVILYVYFSLLPSFPFPFLHKQKNMKKKQNFPLLYLGNDENKMPIEIPIDLFRQHMLLMGTTGSGKTTLLRRLIYSLLMHGGGICFIDGKADVSDMYQIFFAEVSSTDREEDFYLINFTNPAQSHTFNPFLTGDADFLTEVLSGFLKEGGGDHIFWQQRAIIQMRALMSVLVWLRDNRKEYTYGDKVIPIYKLNIGHISEFFNLHGFVTLARDESIPYICPKTGNPARERLVSYLKDYTVEWAQYPKVNDRVKAEMERLFGYGAQEWKIALDLVNFQFGKIFNTDNPDVDIRDIVINNKVLYVLLPSLKFAPQTLSSMGRLIMSTFRLVFSQLIGDQVIGDTTDLYNDVKRKKPDPPFLTIMDEAGSYLPEGLDNVMAQARSTGVGMVISVQELASLFKQNEVLAKRVLQNTKIKIAMAIDDVDTTDYFTKRVGEDWTLVPGSVRKEGNTLMDPRVVNPDGQFNYTKMERVSKLDLHGLGPGEGFILFQNDFRRFYSPMLPEHRPDNMRLLRFEKNGEGYNPYIEEEGLYTQMNKIKTGLVAGKDGVIASADSTDWRNYGLDMLRYVFTTDYGDIEFTPEEFKLFERFHKKYYCFSPPDFNKIAGIQLTQFDLNDFFVKISKFQDWVIKEHFKALNDSGFTKEYYKTGIDEIRKVLVA